MSSKKMMVRGDLSDRVIHLTRRIADEDPRDNFVAIIEQRKLLAGNRCIRGGYNCICFSEAPLAVLANMLAGQSSRYAPFGFMVDKSWLFSIGGRPVIYQPDVEFEMLPEELRYRHVRYEPDNGVDFTWEREWRLRADHLELDPAKVTIVVPNREVVDYYQNKHWRAQQGAALLMGSDGGLFVEPFKWHFVVLEDLGVKVS